MQLIWPGILLSDSLPLLKFLGRGSLLTLLMFLMMRAATSLGVHRGLLNWVLSKGSCYYFNLLLILVNILIFWIFFPTRYGDMPAHNLLWRECEKSSDNVAARLAVIPLVQVPPRAFSLCLPFKWLLPFGEKLLNKSDNVAVFMRLYFFFKLTCISYSFIWYVISRMTRTDVVTKMILYLGAAGLVRHHCLFQ